MISELFVPQNAGERLSSYIDLPNALDVLHPIGQTVLPAGYVSVA